MHGHQLRQPGSLTGQQQREPPTSNDVALGSISVFTSDGDSAGGYYIFQCLLPAKWTIQTLEVEE